MSSSRPGVFIGLVLNTKRMTIHFLFYDGLLFLIDAGKSVLGIRLSFCSHRFHAHARVRACVRALTEGVLQWKF